MTHPSKAKGSRWESAVRDFLADRLGVRVERVPAGASLDRGDLTGVDGWAVECKDVARLDLAGWMDEATAEAGNVGVGVWPVVVLKRRRKPVADGYVVMPLWVWAEVLAKKSR